ncbi:MAG: GHKL domain-containing protein [Anaerovoracaceae bacterium]
MATFYFSGMLLIYASLLMSMLLDLKPMTFKPWGKVLFFGSLTGIILLTSTFSMNVPLETFGKLYPLLGQLPVFLVFLISSKKGFFKTFFVLLTTICFSFPYSLSTTILFTLDLSLIVRCILTLIIAFGILVVLKFTLARDFAHVINYFDSLYIIKFCSVPVFYNILNYSLGRYSPTPELIPIKILLFCSAVAAYYLTITIFRNTKNIEEIQKDRDLIKVHLDAADEQISVLSVSQEQAAIYRHDLRHHLRLISGYISSNDTQGALDYIHEVQSDIEAVTPKKYCANNTINLILSSFYNKTAQVGIDLDMTIDLPDELPFPETEICAILSNALENAIIASSKLLPGKATITLSSSIHKGNLLIKLQNPFRGPVKLAPTNDEGFNNKHGFGIKSIKLLTEKYNGYCSFDASEPIFTMKVVLPIKK